MVWKTKRTFQLAIGSGEATTKIWLVVLQRVERRSSVLEPLLAALSRMPIPTGDTVALQAASMLSLFANLEIIKHTYLCFAYRQQTETADYPAPLHRTQSLGPLVSPCCMYNSSGVQHACKISVSPITRIDCAFVAAGKCHQGQVESASASSTAAKPQRGSRPAPSAASIVTQSKQPTNRLEPEVVRALLF